MKKLLLLFLLFSCSLSAQTRMIEDWQFSTPENLKAEKVKIPHTWNAEDAFDDEPGYRRGKGLYTTSISVEDTSKVYFLKFNAANQVARLYVNGDFAGEHFGGYTAFQFNISPYLKEGENSIKLELDNSYDETVPPLDADFTFYGGIYRNVELIAENKLHFAKKFGTDAVRIDAVPEGNSGEVSFTAEVEIPKNKEAFLSVVLKGPGGEEVFQERRKVTSAEVASEFSIEDPRLWSPEDPNLYEFQMELKDKNGEIQDIYRHKIGFRKFEADTGGFSLNGKELKLIGVNRHQDWQGMGNAVPVEKQLQDMGKIKEMGAKFMRLAHYPQAEEIYQAADSLGLILWSEAPLVNKVPATTDYEAYEKHSLQMQKEHIWQNYNHPSLVFIGYMNEIFIRLVFDKKEGQERDKIIDKSLELAKKLEGLTRSLAPDRITVMAIHGNQIYNETGIADIPMVLGWNLYFGWYDGKIEDLGPFLDKEHREHPNRPLIISEYGVGADVRLHSNQPEKFDFTEEYQLKYHQGYLQQVLERDFVIGMTAWNFADFGSEFRGDTKPHVNQKGILNYDRSPKNIFYWYKTMLRPEEKMSRIYRDVPVHISNSPQKELRIISNQPVIVKLNDKNIGEFQPKEGMVEMNIELQEGENHIEVLNSEGKLQDSLEMEWQKPDFSRADFLALNFGSNSSFAAEDGQLWIPAKTSGVIKTTGETKVVKSTTNIRETREDPLFQTALAGIEEIHLKVPKGIYEVSLFFSNLGKDKALVYELEKAGSEAETSAGDLELQVNGKHIKIGEIEEFHKSEKTVEVKTDGEIRIKAPQGKAFSLSAIQLKKLDRE